MEHREITIKVCDIHIFQHICSSFILYFCVFERWNAIIGLRTIAILWNQLHPDRYQKLDASSNLNQNYCYWKRIQTVEFPIPWPFNLNSRCLKLFLTIMSVSGARNWPILWKKMMNFFWLGKKDTQESVVMCCWQ